MTSVDNQIQWNLGVLLNELVLSGGLELPLLPETPSRLISMCNDPNCSAVDLADTIRRDQSIATHVLKHANSVRYSAGAKIVSLQQAVARLGVQRIREITLVISYQSRIFDVGGFEREVRESFHRSLFVAAFSEEVARCRRLNVEDAFLSGLLHDIGSPVLFQAVSDIQKDRQIVFDADEVAKAVLAYRATVGGDLIESWKLPSRVADAVRHQQGTETEEAPREACLLHFSIALSDALIRGEDDVEPYLRHPLVERLNLYPEQVETIWNKRDLIEDWIRTTQ